MDLRWLHDGRIDAALVGSTMPPPPPQPSSTAPQPPHPRARDVGATDRAPLDETVTFVEG